MMSIFIGIVMVGIIYVTVPPQKIVISNGLEHKNK